MSKALWPILRKAAIGLLIVFALVFVGGVVMGYLGASGQVTEGDAIMIVMSAAAVVITGGAIWVGAAWMRSIDEAAREAHKAAWYWGGSTGMAIGGVFMILATLPPVAETVIAPIQGRTDPAIYMAAGAFGLMGLMLVGYGVVWAWWWLRRR